MGNFKIELLQEPQTQMTNDVDYSSKIETFYKKYGIELNITKQIKSYSIIRYFANINIDDGKTKISKIEKLIDDLSVYLGIKNIKMSIDYSGDAGAIVFEVQRANRQILYLSETLKKIDIKDGLYVNLGKDLNNKDFIINLCDAPHILVAGATGSGKSVLINSILINLLYNYSPNELELVLIDPKKVELNIYNNIEYIKEKIASTTEESRILLINVLKDIEFRYKLLGQKNCRNIENYNKKTTEKLKYKVLVIDELADLLLQDKKNKLKNDITGEMTIENLVCRIAQIGRACGVHLIVATQRPSSDVITGLIKANIPTRIAFEVTNKINSRIILDDKGAEKLTGKGDMILKVAGKNELIRLQGAFVTDEEIEKITNELREQNKNSIEQQQNQIQIEALTNTLQEYQKQRQKQENNKNNEEKTNNFLYVLFKILSFICITPFYIIKYFILFLFSLEHIL